MSPSNHQRPVLLPRRLVCVLTALAVVTAGCTSTHQVPRIQSPTGQSVWNVSAGETIRITLRDGGSAEFRVQSVTPDTITSSDGTKYQQSEITSITRRDYSSPRTAGVIGGSVALILVAAVAVGAIVVSKLFGGGNN